MNRVLLTACILVVVVQVLIPVVPPLASIFRASPLDLSDWLLVAIIALAPVVLAEAIRTRSARTWVA